MYQPLEMFIGLRYVKARSRTGFVSFISLISMMGIGLGVATLIVVIAVMNGFEQEIRQRILGMTAHATVHEYNGRLGDYETIRQKALNTDRILGAAPYIEREAMLSRGKIVRGTLVNGILPDQQQTVSKIPDYIIRGDINNLRAGKFGIVLGVELARILGVRVGDKVTVVAPQASVTPAGLIPRLKRFTVEAIFKADHGQYDALLALVHLEDAKRLFKSGDQISGLRLKVDDLDDAPYIARDFASKLAGPYFVRDWTQLNANFFKAIKTERTVMFLILSLIVAVAAFNIVSTLVMVVMDKQSDIAILRTQGMSSAQIMRVFIIQGTFIGFWGTLFGLILGVSVALNVENVVPWIEQQLGHNILPPDIYYISEVPSDLRWRDVYVTAIVAFMVSILATIYPAYAAAKTRPAQALRYE